MMRVWCIVFSFFACIWAKDYYVKIKDNGPVVLGANITFTANLYVGGGEQPTGNFKYKWRDNVSPQHHNESMNQSQSEWTVSYSPDRYSAGIYKVEVDVFTSFIIDWPECYERSSFEITSTLNGKMNLTQNNTSSTSEYISNATEVLHTIELHKPDAEYLKNKANSVAVFWYMDCNYIGYSNDFLLKYNYTESDKSHMIAAVVIASVKLDSNSSSVILRSNFSSAESSVEIFLINSNKSNDVTNQISPASNNTKFSYLTFNNETSQNATDQRLEFDCAKKTFSSMSNNVVHGLFTRMIEVKAPVSNLKVEGNNWLQHGEILNLQVWCNGSAPFSYCVQFWTGNYTVTGNEKCISKKRYLSVCDFQINHYFGNSTNYTVVIIMENDVQKIVRGINVNVYEVTKHAQLSVIIVPISAGIVAVILIIFGIAFYVQKRNRYIVEVADFDFSNASDMEYKTFRERLVEAVSNAFNKTEDYSEQDSSNGVPTNKKYGSMQ